MINEGNVVAHHSALGQTSGDVLLRRPLTDNYGRSSIVADNSPDGIRVPLKRLDDVLALSDQCYVVKVDVEGAELQVLDGALTTLDKMKVGSFWLVEVHVGGGVDVKAVADRFLKFGYVISRLLKSMMKITKRQTRELFNLPSYGRRRAFAGAASRIEKFTCALLRSLARSCNRSRRRLHRPDACWLPSDKGPADQAPYKRKARAGDGT